MSKFRPDKKYALLIGLNNFSLRQFVFGPWRKPNLSSSLLVVALCFISFMFIKSGGLDLLSKTDQTIFQHEVQTYTMKANDRALDLSEELLSRFLTSDEFAVMMRDRNYNSPATTQIDGFLDFYKVQVRTRKMPLPDQMKHARNPPIVQLSAFGVPLHALANFNWRTKEGLTHPEDFEKRKAAFEAVVTEIEAFISTLPPIPLEDTAPPGDTGLPYREPGEYADGGGL
jgi:hypothetical protein